ncbi:MAG: hypothetical protein ACI8SJ_001490 [Shewanella sp.]|jgi:hypothetical protein
MLKEINRSTWGWNLLYLEVSQHLQGDEQINMDVEFTSIIYYGLV